MARWAFRPENLLEAAALRLNLVPVVLAESFFPFIHARALMAATKLGVFEALGKDWRTPEEVAEETGTDPVAIRQLMTALTGSGYLRSKRGRFKLTPVARWALKRHRQSVRDKILLHYLEWDFVGKLEEYLQTGESLAFHDHMSSDEWKAYQRGMRATVAPFAEETTSRMKLPKGARSMLDIGGSHGFFSVCFCRRNPGLRSTILELSSAIAHAKPLLDAEAMGDRITYRAGDALTDDLGEGEHDLVLIASVIHHFSDEQIRELLPRIRRALRPGGQLAIFEQLRAEPGKGLSQMGAILDLYFGLTSRSGTRSEEEIRAFLSDAGFRLRPTMRMRTIRDLAVISGTA